MNPSFTCTITITTCLRTATIVSPNGRSTNQFRFYKIAAIIQRFLPLRFVSNIRAGKPDFVHISLPAIASSKLNGFIFNNFKFICYSYTSWIFFSKTKWRYNTFNNSWFTSRTVYETRFSLTLYKTCIIM